MAQIENVDEYCPIINERVEWTIEFDVDFSEEGETLIKRLVFCSGLDCCNADSLQTCPIKEDM